MLEADYERAARVFGQLGYGDEGYARIRAGADYLTKGSPAEADVHPPRGDRVLPSARATRFVRQAEELLAGAGLEVPA